MADVSRMPVLFLGHGTPMNALADNQWTRNWARIGAELPRPTAILAISGHWCTHGTGVTAMANPPTIHDFGGFPQALFDIQYPAPGDPALAARVRDLLTPTPVVMDQEWGLDHGTWSVLLKAYPAADIPVVQLSMDMRLPAAEHLALGAKLAPLRDEGVLIIGTGNVVHNLRARQRGEANAYDWAVNFNDHIRASLVNGDRNALAQYLDFGEPARLSVPTPDHYYPLLYAAGAGGTDATTIEVDAVIEGAMSMLSVRFGG
jgi:4,5-DOPA dioxygenase extradiol